MPILLDHDYVGRKGSLLTEFTRQGLKLVRVTKEDREKSIKYLSSRGFSIETRVTAEKQSCD